MSTRLWRRSMDTATFVFKFNIMHRFEIEDSYILNKYCRTYSQKLKITRRVPRIEQELITLPEHMSSLPVFNGVGVGVLCSKTLHCWWIFLCPCLAIVLSFLHRFTASDDHFGIFKLFLNHINLFLYNSWCI